MKTFFGTIFTVIISSSVLGGDTINHRLPKKWQWGLEGNTFYSPGFRTSSTAMYADLYVEEFRSRKPGLSGGLNIFFKRSLSGRFSLLSESGIFFIRQRENFRRNTLSNFHDPPRFTERKFPLGGELYYFNLLPIYLEYVPEGERKKVQKFISVGLRRDILLFGKYYDTSIPSSGYTFKFNPFRRSYLITQNFAVLKAGVRKENIFFNLIYMYEMGYSRHLIDMVLTDGTIKYGHHYIGIGIGLYIR